MVRYLAPVIESVHSSAHLAAAYQLAVREGQVVALVAAQSVPVRGREYVQLQGRGEA